MRVWLVVLLGMFSLPCFAIEEGVEFQLGRSVTPSAAGTFVFFAEGVQDAGVWGSSWEVGSLATIGRLSSRSNAGYETSVWLLGGGIRLQHEGYPWWIEVQAVTPWGRTRAIDGALQVMPSFGVQVGRWGGVIRHVSGVSSSYGRGETMVLLYRSF